MKICNSRTAHHGFVDFRVVFHRARPQGIEACVNTEVVVARIGLMPNYGRFVDFRQFRRIAAQQYRRKTDFTFAVIGECIAFAAFMGMLENERRIQILVHGLHSFDNRYVSVDIIGGAHIGDCNDNFVIA